MFVKLYRFADYLHVAGNNSEDDERWRLVRKYCTDRRAEMDMHEIVDDLYQRATGYMHRGGLRMTSIFGAAYVSRRQRVSGDALYGLREDVVRTSASQRKGSN